MKLVILAQPESPYLSLPLPVLPSRSKINQPTRINRRKILPMRTRASIALLLPLACLLGCTLPVTAPSSTNSPTTPSPTPSGSWENWQIQAGSAITSPPNSYPSFLGAIQIQGAQASGIFTTVEATGFSTAEDYTGAFNSSKDDVTLATYGFGFGYTQPATPYTVVPVGVTGGCVYPPGYTGPECLAIFAVPSVGVQIAPLNGTYTGTLTGTLTTISPATSTPITGTASLTLTQSATPNSSGQFPITGTATFPSGSGMGTATLPGLVSGITIELSTEPCVFPFSNVSCNLIGSGSVLFAYTNPSATQITVTNLQNINTSGTPEAAITLTGTLTLQ
jgi:hypothetical protein